ncbi:hypothetical protein LTR48_001813 [Friedmanniomyces endolithicus]|nr:hypothetical protein LTR48_001813 [Friedmanniomyces endolithicus]
MPSSTLGRSTVAITAAATAASIASVASLLYYFDIPSLLQQRVQSRKVGGSRCFSLDTKPSLPEFRILTQQVTLRETYPLASGVEKNVPIYDCASFDLTDASATDKLQDELYHNLTSGPGVYILRNFFADVSVIDATNRAFEEIITREQEASGTKGDHFALGNANARIWNAFSKHALQDPESYVQYFSNPWFKLATKSRRKSTLSDPAGKRRGRIETTIWVFRLMRMLWRGPRLCIRCRDY